nr:uncharacterized protein CI109_003847 [Kwoniella shandongensis]KAA5527875.1 hypothetical protein CI109_003847 [Kwoniella shandongensis]
MSHPPFPTHCIDTKWLLVALSFSRLAPVQYMILQHLISLTPVTFLRVNQYCYDKLISTVYLSIRLGGPKAQCFAYIDKRNKRSVKRRLAALRHTKRIVLEDELGAKAFVAFSKMWNEAKVKNGRSSALERWLAPRRFLPNVTKVDIKPKLARWYHEEEGYILRYFTRLGLLPALAKDTSIRSIHVNLGFFADIDLPLTRELSGDMRVFKIARHLNLLLEVDYLSDEPIHRSPKPPEEQHYHHLRLDGYDPKIAPKGHIFDSIVRRCNGRWVDPINVYVNDPDGFRKTIDAYESVDEGGKALKLSVKGRSRLKVLSLEDFEELDVIGR